MIFQQPLALWGLLGLVVPVVIHLFNFQKTEKVIFANTRLLTEVVQKTQKARQLKNWILLLFRMVALSALVMAFAQPRFASDNGMNSADGLPQVSVFLDNSISMSVTKEGSKPFDMAWNLARAIPDKFQNKGWFQLITNQFEAKHQWTSANGFRDQVTEVFPASKARKINTVLEKGIRQMKEQPLGDNRTLFVLSDFQKSNVGSLEHLSIDSQAHYQFSLLAQESVANVLVDSVWLSGVIQVQEKSQILKIRLAQSGGFYNKPLNVKLLANGNLISGKTINLNSNPLFDFELPFQIKAGEKLNAEIQLDDAPVSFDNHFYFVIQAPPPVNVVLIDEVSNPFIGLALKHPLFHFKATDPKMADMEAIKKADCIILNEMQTLENALSQAIANRVKSGASVFLLPGKGGKIPDWFPINLSVIPESPGGKATDYRIKVPGKESRFFEGTIAELKPNPSLPYSKPGLQILSGIPLLKFENGESFLSFEKFGNGQVFCLASQLSDGSSNFQKHPIFIPTLFKIALSGSRGSDLPLFYRTNASLARIGTDSIISNAEQPVFLKNGNKEIRIAPRQMGASMGFDLPGDVLIPGIWEVLKGNNSIASIAINAQSEESLMDFYSLEELKNAFSDKPWVTVNEVSSQVSPENISANQLEEFPLWKICLIIGLAFLVGEMLLTRFSHLLEVKK